MSAGKLAFSIVGGIILTTFCLLTGAGIMLSLAIGTIPFWSMVWASAPDRRDTRPPPNGSGYIPEECPFHNRQRVADYVARGMPTTQSEYMTDIEYRKRHEAEMRRKFSDRGVDISRAEMRQPLPTMSQRQITEAANGLLNMALDRTERYSGQISLDDVARRLNDYAAREAQSGRLTEQEIVNMDAIVNKAVDVCRTFAEANRRR